MTLSSKNIFFNRKDGLISYHPPFRIQDISLFLHMYKINIEESEKDILSCLLSEHKKASQLVIVKPEELMITTNCTYEKTYQEKKQEKKNIDMLGHKRKRDNIDIPTIDLLNDSVLETKTTKKISLGKIDQYESVSLDNVRIHDPRLMSFITKKDKITPFSLLSAYTRRKNIVLKFEYLQVNDIDSDNSFNKCVITCEESKLQVSCIRETKFNAREGASQMFLEKLFPNSLWREVVDKIK